MRAIPIILTLVGSAVVAMPAPATAAVTLCDGKVATVVGTSGNDLLKGTPERDVIAGLGGNDKILAGDGDDVICGGDGTDRLFGEAGDDVLFAGRARVEHALFFPDRLDGGSGDDRLEIGREQVPGARGVSGVVTFRSATRGVVVDLAAQTSTGDGNDTIISRPGLEVVGTPFDDVLVGSGLSEQLSGERGADELRGRGGNDHLYGDPDDSSGEISDDRMNGGSGNDEVFGKLGSDTARGGLGRDHVGAGGDGPGRVFGGAGEDFLAITVGSTPGAVAHGGLGRDELSVSAPLAGLSEQVVTVRMIPGTIALDGLVTGRIDHFETVRTHHAVSLIYFGTSGRDVVFAGGNAALRAWTYGGNDLVWGSNEPDYVDAGSGTDEVRAKASHDTCLDAERRGSCEATTP